MVKEELQGKHVKGNLENESQRDELFELEKQKAELIKKRTALFEEETKLTNKIIGINKEIRAKRKVEAKKRLNEELFKEKNNAKSTSYGLSIEVNGNKAKKVETKNGKTTITEEEFETQEELQKFIDKNFDKFKFDKSSLILNVPYLSELDKELRGFGNGPLTLQ